MSIHRPQSRPEPTPRRAQLLTQTLRIVGERGYYGFGLQELADRCGLTKPGLLHHFGSKEQLLIAVLTEVDAERQAVLGAMFGAAFERATSPETHRATLRECLLEIARYDLAEPELMRMRVILRTEAINPDHPAHDYFVARDRETMSRLARGAAPFSSAPEALARQISVMMSGFQAQWLREEGGFDLVAAWDGMLAHLLV